MLGFGKRVVLTVLPDSGTCEIGEPVAVRVRAVARKDCHIRRGEVILQTRIWTGESQDVPTTPVTRRDVTRTLTLSRAELPIAGPLPAGATVEGQAVLSNPAPCPSGKAARISVEYFIRAELELTGARTVAGLAPVPMSSGRALHQGAEGRARVQVFRACELDLRLPVLHAQPGESLAGVLLVRARQPLIAQRVLAYWRRAEDGSSTDEYSDFRHTVRTEARWPRLGGLASATLADDVALTAPREFPFSVRVPERACPTLDLPVGELPFPVPVAQGGPHGDLRKPILAPLAPSCSVRWYLRAAVHYRDRPADLLEREINVHTAP